MPDIALDTRLATPRLTLRAVDVSDIELVWSATRVEGFNDGMTWDPPSDREQIEIVTRGDRLNWQEGREYVFTMVRRADESPVGRIGVHRENERGAWHLGFWVHPDHWGHGYATEAGKAVIDFAFERLGARKITTKHATWNRQSQRVIEKLGFTFLWQVPCGFIKHGRPVPEYVYELTDGTENSP